MADDNEPKTPRTPADKERSRRQSRPISGKQAARTTTGNQPGRASRATAKKASGGTAIANAAGSPGAAANGAAGRRPSTATAKGPGRGPKGGGPGQKGGGGRTQARPGRPAAGRRSTTSLLTWGAVALVLVIVVVLVVVKVTGSSTPGKVNTQFVPVSDTVAHNATSIPESVFNTVGINSSAAQISPPTLTKGQTRLAVDGKPGVFYYGAEYCPYCAAERWALVAALSRFGTFSNLGAMESSTNDVYPGTQTFTFAKVKYTSPYIGFRAEEYLSNQPLANGNGYTVLQPPTAGEQKLISTYDSVKYFTADANGPSFPLVDIGNQALLNGASFSPSLLSGLSRDQIAAGLSDPTNPVTQSIVATSNYISASICEMTHGQPASVCQSKGVLAAAKAQHLTY